MKYDFELLKADILKELDNIKIVEAEFTKINDMLRLPAERVPFYDRGAIGYILHNFYNGCENILGKGMYSWQEVSCHCQEIQNSCSRFSEEAGRSR